MNRQEIEPSQIRSRNESTVGRRTPPAEVLGTGKCAADWVIKYYAWVSRVRWFPGPVQSVEHNIHFD
jgi:hypothetical protein